MISSVHQQLLSFIVWTLKQTSFPGIRQSCETISLFLDPGRAWEKLYGRLTVAHAIGLSLYDINFVQEKGQVQYNVSVITVTPKARLKYNVGLSLGFQLRDLFHYSGKLFLQTSCELKFKIFSLLDRLTLQMLESAIYYIYIYIYIYKLGSLTLVWQPVNERKIFN